jgi:glycerol uptake facilitator protein
MTPAVVGEFMGTLTLVVLGDGVVAGVLLKKSKAESSGWIVITAGWAFAVMCGVFVSTACGSRDAHLNPAVTLGIAVYSGDFSKLLPYIAAQMLGAFSGAALVWMHYAPHWKETSDPRLKLACFCTGPAVDDVLANLFSEILATCFLVFVIGAIFSRPVAGSGYGSGVAPFLVACLVWGIGLSLGGTTGYAINPARDLGPRIAHSVLPIAGKGGSEWRYAGIPVVGPLIGGSLAGWLMRAFHF